MCLSRWAFWELHGHLCVLGKAQVEEEGGEEGGGDGESVDDYACRKESEDIKDEEGDVRMLLLLLRLERREGTWIKRALRWY